MDIWEIATLAIAIFLIVSPFLIGIGIYRFLSPVSFWEKVACIIIILIVAGTEGIAAWIIALLITTIRIFG